jgi:hypothetical protein
VTPQIQKELAVGKVMRPAMSGMDGERRLTDPGHSVDRDDHRACVDPHLLERREIGGPTGELGRGRRELPHRPDGLRGRPRLRPLTTAIGGRPARARCASRGGHESRVLRRIQTEPIGELPQRGAVRPPAAGMSLEPADRAHAQPGPLGKLLLREESTLPQGPQQLAEWDGPLSVDLGTSGHRSPFSPTSGVACSSLETAVVRERPTSHDVRRCRSARQGWGPVCFLPGDGAAP